MVLAHATLCCASGNVSQLTEMVGFDDAEVAWANISILSGPLSHRPSRTAKIHANVEKTNKDSRLPFLGKVDDTPFLAPIVCHLQHF